MILYKSPAEAVAAPFCLTTFLSPLASSLSLSLSSLFLFPSSDPRVYFLTLSSLSVLVLAIRPTILVARSRSPRALRRSSEARDRRSYRWQRDSFVLSRRFQLIFIVYLPEQRYLEDNGPPRYIRSEPYHANTESIYYLLPLPGSARFVPLTAPAFDLSETDCVNRHR